MKKIIFLLVLVLFITGCASGLQLGSKKTTSSGKPDGLHISFLQPEEGSDIDEGSNFLVVIEIYNGADLEIQGDLCLSDTWSGSRSAVKDDCKFISVDKKSKYQDFLSFGPYVYSNIVSTQNFVTPTIITSISYPCSFVVTPVVCMRRDLLDEKEEADCKREETLSVSTAGFVSAPITVSKIVKKLKLYDVGGMKADLEIHLKKMSDGKLEGPLNINLDYGDAETRCKDLDEIILNKGDTEKVINCEIIIKDMEKYELIENILVISLDYNYEQEQALRFNVVDTGEEDGVY